MTSRQLPAVAAWRHRNAREGFEVVFLRSDAGTHRLEGQTTAVEDGEAWAVSYSVVLDTEWVTRSAHVISRSVSGRVERRLEADGTGGWRVDGARAPHLDGCRDVDLESSVVTNALPIHRLRLGIGESAEAPAAFVRAPDLRVERLEQRYQRIGDTNERARYAYAAPRFDYSGELTYDVHGLVLEYPGIAARVL